MNSCPSCGGSLEIRELWCPSCEIQIRGRFEPSSSPFAHLSVDQAAFLRLFVTSRGNLSDLERSLGISYASVRAKLDELIAALSGQPGPITPAGAPPSGRQEILALIAEGRLTALEGVERLKQLGAREGR